MNNPQTHPTGNHPAVHPQPAQPQVIIPPGVMARLAAHCARRQPALGQAALQQQQYAQRLHAAATLQPQQAQSAVPQIGIPYHMGQQRHAYVGQPQYIHHQQPVHPHQSQTMHHLYPLGIFPPSCMMQQQSAGAPAVRFGVGSQLQQFGVAPVEDSGFAPAGRIATGSVRSMQLLSYRSQALPAPVHPPRDATNTVVDTDDNARSQAHSEDVDDDGSSFTTTPPCSPSPRSSRELSSEPSTPLYLLHLQSSQGDGNLIAVVRSTSSSPNEDYVVESSDEDEEDDPPPRSPRGPPSPTPPPPPPPPAAKIFCRGMTRKEYSQAYYQLNKDRIREYNGEYYRINRERIRAEAKEKHEARRGKEKLGKYRKAAEKFRQAENEKKTEEKRRERKVQHDQGNNELLNLPRNELSK